MITKKQLLKALSILDDEDMVMALYKGNYGVEYQSYVNGVKIVFENGDPKALILVKELDAEELKAA